MTDKALPPEDSLTMCGCGRGKKCPKIERTAGGYVLSDEDQPGGPLRLTDEQAEQLRDWLNKTRGQSWSPR